MSLLSLEIQIQPRMRVNNLNSIFLQIARAAPVRCPNLVVTTHAVQFKLLTASLNELQISSPSTQPSQVTTLRSSTDKPEGHTKRWNFQSGVTA